MLRALRKAGKWVDEDATADADGAPADDLLPGLAAAAVAGRAAFGARAGRRDGRVGGEHFVCVARHLPEVLSLRAAWLV